MNKQELIVAVAHVTGAHRAVVAKVIEAIMDPTEGVIARELVQGNKVTYGGFGSFVVMNKAARTCRNPQNGEPVAVPARKVPAFRAGKVLKATVQGA